MVLKIFIILYLLSFVVCFILLYHEINHSVIVDPKEKFLHDDFEPKDDE